MLAGIEPAWLTRAEHSVHGVSVAQVACMYVMYVDLVGCTLSAGNGRTPVCLTATGRTVVQMVTWHAQSQTPPFL